MVYQAPAASEEPPKDDAAAAEAPAPEVTATATPAPVVEAVKDTFVFLFIILKTISDHIA